MKVYFLIFFGFLIISIQSCTTNVQTRYNLKIPKSNLSTINNNENTTQPEIVIDQTPPEITSPPTLTRYYDTIEIELTNIQIIPTEISRGKELLSGGEYRNALQSFISYINRSQKKDYFYWLARTYVAECLYQMNQYEQALDELTELFYCDELQTEIKANVILKLSEIYCRKNEMDKARYYFELYKTISTSTTLIQSFECQ